VFGAVAGAGDPDEEIVVQKVVPTRPELSLEIGVLWLGLGISLPLSGPCRGRLSGAYHNGPQLPLCLSMGERQYVA